MASIQHQLVPNSKTWDGWTLNEHFSYLLHSQNHPRMECLWNKKSQLCSGGSLLRLTTNPRKLKLFKKFQKMLKSFFLRIWRIYSSVRKVHHFVVWSRFFAWQQIQTKLKLSKKNQKLSKSIFLRIRRFYSSLRLELCSVVSLRSTTMFCVIYNWPGNFVLQGDH